MAERYKVLSVRPSTYVGKSGRVIQGYSVLFELPEYDEEHELNVPDSRPETVKDVLSKFADDRDAIANI